MEQLGFKGGGLRASDGAESMEGVMALNLYHQAVIKYSCHRLPHHLHQAYPKESPDPLWD